MKKSVKAALMSALVFPGTGHLYLKKYISGMTLIIINCVSVYYVVSSLLREVMQITGQIMNGTDQPDLGTITNLVAQQSSSPQAQMMNAATTVILICWVVGIIDSFRLGRANEKAEGHSVAGENKPDE